jgi:ARG/rhodanese/phosphatase superfamily protein
MVSKLSVLFEHMIPGKSVELDESSLGVARLRDDRPGRHYGSYVVPWLARGGSAGRASLRPAGSSQYAAASPRRQSLPGVETNAARPSSVGLGAGVRQGRSTGSSRGEHQPFQGCPKGQKRLSVENPTDLPLLVYEGEEVLGAQQNRTFDATALCPPASGFWFR